MRHTAVIEIPKGSDRRIHMRYDGSGFEDFGPIKEKIPVNDGVMPVAYGYIKNSLNKTEGDNVDAIVFSDKELDTADEIEIRVIGLLNREDGDHKVIAADESIAYESFSEVATPERELILDYFGYGHSITVEDRDKGLAYLAESSAIGMSQDLK